MFRTRTILFDWQAIERLISFVSPTGCPLLLFNDVAAFSVRAGGRRPFTHKGIRGEAAKRKLEWRAGQIPEVLVPGQGES